MAVKSGRDLVLKYGGTTLAGLRTTSISLDGSPVDVTNVGSAGFRTLASFSGSKSLTITADGVWDAATNTDVAFAPSGALLLTNVTVVDGEGDTIDGDFFIASYEETGTHDDAITFSITLESSGAWTRA